MQGRYILVGQTPVPCDDLLEWAHWFGNPENRLVRWTRVGVARVSTVFLGLDYTWGDGPPALFETMIFRFAGEGPLPEPLEDYQERSSTWLEAERMHAEAVEAAVKVLGPDVEQLWPEPLPAVLA